MAGTIRQIIDRIKEQRSAGNSVVALTVETRLVLQGFDPERYEYDTPDDPGRLARIQEVATEMDVETGDLVAQADVEPDPEAAPAPPPEVVTGDAAAQRTQSAQDTAAAAGLGHRSAPGPARPAVPGDHPLQPFQRLADEALAGAEGASGEHSGASFATLMKANLLMGLYSIRADAVFCDQLRYNGLFQWFLGLSGAAVDWSTEAFSTDREAALASAAGRAFFDRLVPAAGNEKAFSQTGLQVDGRRIKSWMSQSAHA